MSDDLGLRLTERMTKSERDQNHPDSEPRENRREQRRNDRQRPDQHDRRDHAQQRAMRNVERGRKIGGCSRRGPRGGHNNYERDAGTGESECGTSGARELK